MRVQELMDLSDDELARLGIDELKKLKYTYMHFNSTKAFASRCEETIKSIEEEK